MGFFDSIGSGISGLFGNTDPLRASQIRGAMLGAAQSLMQPYAGLGNAVVGAGVGYQGGKDKYYQDMNNAYGLADSRIGMQQKLGQMNFLRTLQGQQPLTNADIMNGNFGTSSPPIGSVPAATPNPVKVAVAADQAPNNAFDVANFYKSFIAPHEGGYTAQDGNGSPANFGINQKANPNIDVKSLTPGTAQDYLTKNYFAPSGATSMQGPMAAIQADTAMNMGKGAAAQLLDQSGGDPQKYLDLREQRYRDIAAANPAKAPLLSGWLQRNNDLRAYVAQNTQAQPQQQQEPQAAPGGAANLVPDALKQNPLFIAAVQSGDMATVMKMIQGNRSQMTPEELTAAGYRPGTVAYRDPYGGKPEITQTSDVKSPEAVKQTEDISAEEAKAKRDAVVAAVDPSYIDNQAHAIATYRVPAGSMSLRYPEITSAIMSKVYAENPNYDVRKYNGANATVVAFDKDKQGDQTRSFNTAVAHLNTLEPLVTALNNKDIKAINSVGNFIKTQFGLSTAPTTFEAVKTVVGDEIVKAIIGSGGGVGDREALAATMNKANSPKLIMDVLDKYKDLMGGQLAGLQKQYESSTGLKDFNDKLLPETIKVLENRGKGEAGPKIDPKIQAQITPANLQATAMKRGMTVDQVKADFRAKGYKVP